MSVAHTDEMLTTAEFAQRVRQAESSIRRKVADGAIAAYRVGEHGPLRIPATELEKQLRPVGRNSAGRSLTAGTGSAAPSAGDRALHATPGVATEHGDDGVGRRCPGLPHVERDLR